MADTDCPDSNPAPPGAVELLTALFRPEEYVLFRFIEVWNDAESKKQSRVAHDKTRWWKRGWLTEDGPEGKGWADTLRWAEEERASIFFGTLPRFGPDGYDFAWQARRVPHLYSDADGVTPRESEGRVEKAGLPPPSIVVGSGSGAHLYWLLEEPYLIDDADGGPPRVKRDWQGPRRPNGKKWPREYIEVGGRRVWRFLQQDDGRPTRRE